MTTNTIPATCPDMGEWRAWLDAEPADARRLAAHLDACPGCQNLVAELRDDAEVASRLRLLAPQMTPSTADVAVARARLWRSSPREPAPIVRLPRLSSGWRVALSGLAAAVVVSFLVAFTPEGRALAAGFLAQFRSQQVTAIAITPQSQADIARTIQTLSNLGTVEGAAGADQVAALQRSERSNQQTNVSLEDASKVVRFTLKTPDPATLPAGVSNTPRISVMPATTERFTFSKDKAEKYFQSTGHPEVKLPDQYDGATLVVSIPAAALLQYGGTSGREALIVGEAGELVVDVQGKVSLDEMRDFLLGLPGLPPATVAQLRQIHNWNETLPIPVPVDKVNWQQTSFPNGGQGLLLNDNSGIGSAAIWHSSGHLYGVAGSLKATDLKRVADSLH